MSTRISIMTYISWHSAQKLLTTAFCTKVICFSVHVRRHCSVLLHSHTADRVGSHTCTPRHRTTGAVCVRCKCGDHFFKFAVFEPQNPVGDILDTLIMRDNY